MGNKPASAEGGAREIYTAEERAALQANAHVVLPCHAHPFLGFGPKRLVKQSQAQHHNEQSDEPEIANKWPLIQHVLSQEIADYAQFEAAMTELNPDIPLAYFKARFSDPTSPNYTAFFGQETEIQAAPSPLFEMTGSNYNPPATLKGRKPGVLAFMQTLALRLPELFPEDKPLPLLLPRQEASVTLSQEQIACLLTHAFFCTLYEGQTMALCDFNSISFSILYSDSRSTCASTADCIMHYFERVSQSMPQGFVTFSRQVLENSDVPNWAESKKPIRPVQAHAKGNIESSGAILQADFANQYIGGGVLTGGCVQEEILFAVKTECLASMQFCAKMEPNEAILITGAEMFSQYQGYGRNYKYGGDFIDNTPRDDQNRIKTIICAMDACIPFGGGSDFTPRLFHRDLNKAYVAFFERGSGDNELGPVATGNWGCGAFGGDKSIKFFQQLLAASESGREMWWYTFGEGYKDKKLDASIMEVMAIIEAHKYTVGDVYSIILGCLEEGRCFNLFEYFTEHEHSK